MTDPDSPLQKLVSAWVARRPSCLRGAPAGSQGARARNPSDRDGTRGGWGMETRSAGPGGFRALIPRHPARVGEIMQVRWFDYYGAMLFGGRHERYTRSFLFGDRFELPSGARVGLWHLVGFKLQLAPRTTPPPPVEEVIAGRRSRREPDRVSPPESSGTPLR